jgi:hypothetical protein
MPNVEPLPHRNVTDPPRLRKPGRREQVIERRAAAIRLRRAGAGYREIARQLGVSPMQAHRDVGFALRQVNARMLAEADTYRALELERLDGLLMYSWRAAQDGSVHAILAALRVCESRRRLLGLDAMVEQFPLPQPPPLGAELADVPTAQLHERFQRLFCMTTIEAEVVPPPPTPAEPEATTPAKPHDSDDDLEARIAAYAAALQARTTTKRLHNPGD